MLYRSVLVLIALTSCMRFAKAKLGDDLVELQIFATSGEPLKVAKTLENLNYLASFYKIKNHTNSPDRSDQVKALIEASLISTNKCDRISLLQRWSLLEYHSDYTVNLIPYLKYYWAAQFALCNNVFVDALQVSINSLDKDVIKFMALLRKSIIDSNDGEPDLKVVGPFFSVSIDSYKEAILVVMEQLVGSETKFKQNKITGNSSDFAFEFENTVKEPCRKIRSQLLELMENYEMFLYHKDLAASMDPLAQEWITNVKICEKITDAGVQLTLDTYQTLITRKQMGFRKQNTDVLRYLFSRAKN